MSIASRSFTALAAVLCLEGAALAADAPPAADVLTKLHESNLKEIEMGKIAQKNGQSKEVKSYGKMLVKDHTAADSKVKQLAKQENVDLPATPPAMNHDDMGTGADFDKKFVQSMV